jgi:serine protease
MELPPSFLPDRENALLRTQRLSACIGATVLLVGATVVLVGATVAATAGGPAGADTASATSAAKVFFWPQGGTPAGLAPAAPSADQYNNLIFHGGAVEHQPHVYITYWGTEWQSGFQTGPGNAYSNKTAMNYVTNFFANIGGSAWNGTQTQYCDNIAPGSTSCAGQPLAQYIANTPKVLARTWIDPTPVPATIVTSGLAENLVDDPIASEAVKASEHFGFDMDATYFVFTPPGHAATAYGTVYCAYHSEVTNVGEHGIKYAFMPYTPEQGAGCGGNSVNTTNDAFGHGYLDSYSLAGGHEYAEAATDPDTFPTQDGWNDYQTSENGDKCAYFHPANIKIGHYYYAVQPMWSNEANGGTGGCAMSRGTGPAPVPSAVP